jgi:enediyne biosynthesis protein E4
MIYCRMNKPEHIVCVVIAGVFLLAGCTAKKTPVLFELLDNTGIKFTNTVSNTKDINIFTYRNFYNGGGVGMGDINNDGLADVFFTSNMGQNKLYLNKGNMQFEDITAKAGIASTGQWSTGVVFADINHDGWLDIYVSNAGQEKIMKGQTNQLFINNQKLGFTEMAKEYGLAQTGYTTQTAFFDYDLDGDLDAYILNNSFIPVNTLNYSNKRELRAEDWPVADFLKGGGDKLLRNDNGKFTDVTKTAGIYSSLIGFGLGVTVGDVNGDGYPDLYISNDFFEKDYLYINQKNGTFTEDIENRVQHLSLASMGADIADVNNDGYPDIFTTDMLPDDEDRLKTTASFDNIDDYNRKVSLGFYRQFMQNTMQVNNRSGKFMETAYLSGVAASDWSWGGLIFDADNDGLSDLYVCNGIYHDVTDQDFINFFADAINQRMVMTGEKTAVDSIIGKMPSRPILNKAFRNKGGLQFSDEGVNWGFTKPSFSNGAAYGDLDNDGDLDLIINNVNQPAFVYKNNSREQNKNNYISLLLTGTGSNSFAIGSTIKVYQGSQIISREVIPSRGFQSSVDYQQVIGLGNGLADSVVISWPDQSVTTMIKPGINQLHKVSQVSGKKLTAAAITPLQNGLLQQVPVAFDKHTENEFIDFYDERNIPVMLSREGPKAAQGDVNGDGLEDLYIGGAANQGGQLYIQTAAGGFEKKESPVFKMFAGFEDAAVLFFDCDKDSDLDLFVGSGGNTAQANSREIQNRLYINDGKGNYTINTGALPINADNCGAVAANDFDDDGDMDLFVGSRCVTKNYGTTPTSYILVNNGAGIFKDMGTATNPGIAFAGMVNAATWVDIAGDKKKELMITGDWMAPVFFSYNGNNFSEVKTNLSALKGFWQSAAAADLDGDGDEDLVLGNMGENFYLRTVLDKPVKLFINDFDGNGSVEKIMTRTVGGKDIPVFMKREMVEQIPSLKKQNLKNSDYAGKSIQNLFTPELIKKCIVKELNYAVSIIAINEGNGKFTIKEMPLNVQLSCVAAILCTDVNADGKPDLVMGGNNFNFIPQFGRLDASFGHVLINKGAGNFDWLPATQSGLELSGEIKDIRLLSINKAKHVLVLQNNEVPVLYKLRQSQ